MRHMLRRLLTFSLIFLLGLTAAYAADINYVTDPMLHQQLVDHTMQELRTRFPALTEEQLARFTITLYEFDSGDIPWRAEAMYDGCYTMFLNFDIVPAGDGFETVWCMPWDLEKLVELYDAAAPREDALAVARLHFAKAILTQMNADPLGTEFVETHGWRALAPDNFMVTHGFWTPYNQGGEDEPVQWVFVFYYPNDLTRADSGSNPLWYSVHLDAATLELLGEDVVDMFHVQ